jgi:hypothetical protein
LPKQDLLMAERDQQFEAAARITAWICGWLGVVAIPMVLFGAGALPAVFGYPSAVASGAPFLVWWARRRIRGAPHSRRATRAAHLVAIEVLGLPAAALLAGPMPRAVQVPVLVVLGVVWACAVIWLLVVAFRFGPIAGSDPAAGFARAIPAASLDRAHRAAGGSSLAPPKRARRHGPFPAAGAVLWSGAAIVVAMAISTALILMLFRMSFGTGMVTLFGLIGLAVGFFVGGVTAALAAWRRHDRTGQWIAAGTVLIPVLGVVLLPLQGDVAALAGPGRFLVAAIVTGTAVGFAVAVLRAVRPVHAGG